MRVWGFLIIECVLASVSFLTQLPQVDGPIFVLMLLLALNVAAIYPIEIYGDTYISIGDA